MMAPRGPYRPATGGPAIPDYTTRIADTSDGATRWYPPAAPLPIQPKGGYGDSRSSYGGHSKEAFLQGGAAVSIRPTADFGLGRSACAEASAACADGLARRAAARGWALTRAEMEELDALTSPASNPTLFSTTGCPDSFFAGKPFGPG